MSRTLLVAFDAKECNALAGFGAAIGVPYDFLIIKGQPSNAFGAGKVLAANLDDVPPAEACAEGIAAAAQSYSHIVAVSSMRAKDVMARAAGLLDAAMVTDAVHVESPTVFRRPIVAGTLIETVEILSNPVVITFRPAGFRVPAESSHIQAEAVAFPVDGPARRTSVDTHSGSRPDLSQAKIVVSGGRPLRDAETFEKVIGGLADALGGAVGATRAAVDSGIAPNELQVGQTGKVVAPDLYIAAGISGSTQHMAGIKDSKIIVAINRDPDAPIFEFADLGIVADLFQVIPEIMQKIRK